MKTFLAARLLFLAVAISGFAFAAESTVDRADDLVVFGDTRRVSIGMNRDQVFAWMQGHPDETFAYDVWIYWDCYASDLPPRYKSYTALVIIFVADRVKLIRHADPEALKALLIRCRAAAKKRVAALLRAELTPGSAAAECLSPQRSEPRPDPCLSSACSFWLRAS